MLNIVIPLAGKGRRFTECGDYTYPKPLIPIRGEAMIAKVIENLKPKEVLMDSKIKFIYLVQEAHTKEYDLESVLKQASGEFEYDIITLNDITEGAACTVLRAIDLIDNDDELMLANSDQLILSNGMNTWWKHITENRGNMDGCIMTFPANHPKWSYALLDEEGNVIMVAEKKVLSDKASTGIYWFKKGSDFVAGAKEMIRKNIRTNNEFYVCPVYNELILQDKIVRVCDIPANNMRGIGDPESLEEYLTTLR